MDELTERDYEILLEAVDEWVSKDFGALMMGGLLGCLIPKDDVVGRQQWEEKRCKEEAKMKREKQLRKEQCIILKAKLLKLRDRATADSL